MAIHLLAMMLLGGAVGGDATAKSVATPTVETLPVPPSVVNLRLGRAEREFRIQTYEKFHRDRPEYDRRMAIGLSLERQYAEAGSNLDDQAKLIAWFEQAAAGTSPVAELPAAPRIVVVVQKPLPKKALADDEDDGIDGKKEGKEATKSKSAADSTQVKTAGATTEVLPPEAEPPATAASAATPSSPKSKSTVISSLPSKIGAEVDRAFEKLSGESPAADSN
jgi:hypothetical protein